MTRVGIVGHSDLAPTCVSVLRTALRRLLVTHARVGRLVGVSCLAPGADQLFAREVLDVGGHLEAILPAPDYRTRQIDPDCAPEFDRLLGEARSVRVMEFERCCTQARMAASTALVSSVDMVAAIWDGRSCSDVLTGDVIATARGRGVPVAVIWPATAQRTPVAEPAW
ncbi:MAG TPA: hypothetical protein VGH99_00760 [Pseudonocardia sp.]|jgi:hypothetical protein